MRVLTLDLGNTAVKVVDWSAGAPADARASWDEDWRAALAAAIAPGVDLALVSSVVDAERRDAVAAWLRERAEHVRVNPAPPLAVDCRSEETIGRDRLYAALGAWALGSEPALVVDAGTAVTVDALGAPGGAPTFHGGAIAPGPRLLVEALRAGGAQLAGFPNEPRPDAPALGKDSREALEAGVTVGFQGAVRELVRRVAAEAGLGDAPVWLAGGAARLLGDALFDDRDVRREPRLVHHGLRATTEGAGG